MAPRASLSAFLATAKSALAQVTSKKQNLTFVVGNESAGKVTDHLSASKRKIVQIFD
jgi:hypothetical protein